MRLKGDPQVEAALARLRRDPDFRVLVELVKNLYRVRLRELLRGQIQVEWLRGNVATLDELLRLFLGTDRGDDDAASGGGATADR